MTPLSGPSNRSAAGIQRRPKDRKAQITRAAAESFSKYGYHAASMEAIAGKVGISAPALYRHYPNKYAMFSSTVLALTQQLVDATDGIAAVPDSEVAADPAAVLDRAVDALIDVSLRNRETGGLYRWQARYLNADDSATLMDQMRLVNRRIQRPLQALRPELTSAQRWILSPGLLSVIGSIVDHPFQLPDDEIRALLSGAAASLLRAELPQPGDVAPGRPSVWRVFSADAGVYEALLHAAMVLFGNQGYAETTVSQIAEAAGMPVSGIYRYFSSKDDILTTGLQRAVERVTGELMAIAGIPGNPRDTLTRVLEAYVATSFANPELSLVYNTERVNLPESDRDPLRTTEQATIDALVQLLTAVRPELHAMQARFLVYIAVALIADLGRLATDDTHGGGSAYPQACVQTLIERALLGDA